MKEISIFDVIGPNMIGPSSSHTAGALRISLLAGKLVKERIVKAEFTLYGSFAKTYRGHGTDRALVAGILGFGTEDARIKESFCMADEAGLQYHFEVNETEKDLHPNTVDIAITAQSGTVTTVRGVSTGGGNCKIERINGVNVSLSGNYNTLLIRQLDKPGVVAYITKILSEYQINIAFMRMYRENKGETAYTIIEVDGDIPEGTAEKIESNQHIESALLIHI
ncbi:L-serine ammonia-lyase, iron-sulfur-dependent subunit beta [Hydrogenoanaerobacterium sp.]|uniref:L-serine ammonia-lyase, iron-sulfur-dependent subunit beta n=1 Tax=Hydrogenoanaerobacterium sp. TaxID=2953763 RepID=UPI00289B5A48|nr:L-serine ammonia-lyase, iron-sulfur-dependent subunit beta [Hydrogenoanaerobacterium sp.]